jgi:hypothetical protein
VSCIDPALASAAAPDHHHQHHLLLHHHHHQHHHHQQQQQQQQDDQCAISSPAGPESIIDDQGLCCSDMNNSSPESSHAFNGVQIPATISDAADRLNYSNSSTDCIDDHGHQLNPLVEAYHRHHHPHHHHHHDIMPPHGTSQMMIGKYTHLQPDPMLLPFLDLGSYGSSDDHSKPHRSVADHNDHQPVYHNIVGNSNTNPMIKPANPSFIDHRSRLSTVLTGAELHPGDLWHDAEDHDNGLLYHRRF